MQWFLDFIEDKLNPAYQQIQERLKFAHILAHLWRLYSG